ncbi:MAG: aminopeptidase P family protein [Candidatus Riflebacteria bacterium]|nr:aminopeptidase P family protein [Candidatus Riflebacteria bacterium]
MNHSKRIAALRELFTDNYNGMLITNLNNVRYLCGYSGSCGTLLVTKKDAVFFTDFRYQEQSAAEIGDAAEIVIFKNNQIETMKARIKKARIKALGVEKSINIRQFLLFSDEFKKDLYPTENLVERLRQIKDADELKSLKKAFAIADGAFAELMKVIKPGMTENEVAAHLEFFMKMAGSEAPSFATIIASGPNSSCPHHQPGSRKLKSGEMVKIDFGAVADGYHSDMTRTVFLGKATAKFKKIYATVLEAQKKAIKALKVGAICKDIDSVARKVITDAGYGDNFGHGLGHSLGLDVHEAPSLSQKCEDEVRPGVTLTVEPGIYLPGWGGIRIEDTFMVQEKGLLRLTNTPNDLFEVTIRK